MIIICACVMTCIFDRKTAEALNFFLFVLVYSGVYISLSLEVRVDVFVVLGFLELDRPVNRLRLVPTSGRRIVVGQVLVARDFRPVIRVVVQFRRCFGKKKLLFFYKRLDYLNESVNC